ncbi:hypothetical protein M9458_053848, partial [Cirrhinus mrigala]
DKGDPRFTVRNAPHGVAPLSFGVGAGSSRGMPDVSFGAFEEDKMSITASEEGLSSSEAEDSGEQPPTPRKAELTAMLLQASKTIGLEVDSPPSPERLRLDDWYL